MKRYGYDMMKDGSDYNLITTILFNPNYSIKDWLNFNNKSFKVYKDFISSNEFKSFSLKNRYEYKVPYYNINGDMDYQTNYKLANDYYNKVNAPKKGMYMMKNTTHGLLESKSEEFSKILHELKKEAGN